VNVVFQRSFEKDIKKIRGKQQRRKLVFVIEAIEAAETMEAFPNLKRLSSDGSYYRIRIGDYRLGLQIEADTVTFVRFLHRRDIYRYFP
jgi:mRNA interferase RelE/StbE